MRILTNALKAFIAGGCRALFVVFTAAAILAVLVNLYGIYAVVKEGITSKVFLITLPAAFVLGGFALLFGWVADELY